MVADLFRVLKLVVFVMGEVSFLPLLYERIERGKVRHIWRSQATLPVDQGRSCREPGEQDKTWHGAMEILHSSE
jgi:hypothetical protein